MTRFVPLAEVTRGKAVESLHLGAVAVVDANGRLVARAGDPELAVFTRSTLKPFQAAPLLRAGGVGHFGLSAQEIALMCASHSGEPVHVQGVQAILDKIGCAEHHLQCGCHAPIGRGAGHLADHHASYNQLHNNCSGKHAGFLAYCVQHGLPLATYLDPDHPLQQAVRASVAHFAGVDEAGLQAVIDGCSAPNYALPLSRLAFAYARLARGAADAEYGNCLAQLFAAMTTYPELVAGSGRFDLALMQSAPGEWVAKGGAEGVQAVGLRSAGLGFAIKVADGNARAAHPAAIAVLEQLGLPGAVQAGALAAWRRPPLRNLRGIAVGEVRATVKLA